ncbi:MULTISPECIES: NADPH-dependent FMN reductase [Auritidibacter]|uniref:NADPH-dependent FMN reductase n=1 Tax=Auritidibacter TaxID=1160973 RepID=UPI000D7311F6|nr:MULTISPECIES: NAD(P)H-dependent oxidoreductase [Auritidibacter]PXA82179.1 NADPH-dependent oxidoreductase [Auritidibacter sp. NML120779]NIH72421.1 NAD(P)H-dependent FMN reductase [Auritidibacter ignavus]PXA80658.1 NADPH-dependent oxidoreductase [Auritidibacter sp. NML120636]RMX23412.1 NADPH-dependent oxidoreductase [Auritidibacter ignavus]WGH83274.1 NAD(P)H-dependent oxidoreductase [Auritidibacter ignavus]
MTEHNDTTADQLPRLGVVIGSIRTPRKADSVADWVRNHLEAHDYPAEFTVLDLKDFELPPLEHFNQHSDQHAPADLVRWRDAVDGCEGFLFITPEYNRAAPGYFKNAYDLLDVQWKHKPVGFISYGGVGGARAVDQWRVSMAPYGMYTIGQQILLYNRYDFDSDTLQVNDRHEKSLGKLLEELHRLTVATRPLRQN